MSTNGTITLTADPQRVNFDNPFPSTPLIEVSAVDPNDFHYFGVAVGFVDVDPEGFTVHGWWPPGRDVTPLVFDYTATAT